MNGSIGQQLKELRELKSMSLEQVSHATHIRLHYLKALEAGEFHALPSPAQVRGFMRTYAGYLGMDAKDVLAALAQEFPAAAAPTTPQRATPQQVETFSHQAEEAFAEIGNRLKTQRELLGLALEDVERHTHIRSHYLEALEVGEMSGLPSPVQGRGMLKNYTNFIGLDPEPLLLKYAEGLQADLIARQSVLPPRRPPAVHRFWSERTLGQRLFSTDFVIGGLVIAFLVGFSVWGGLRIADLRAGQAFHSGTQTSAVLLVSSGETPNPLLGTPLPGMVEASPQGQETVEADVPESETGEPPGEAGSPGSPLGVGPTPSATVDLNPPLAADAPVQVYVIVRQRAWMRAVVDDEVEFEGRVAPGSAYQFDGESRIEILTGNGAGLQLYYNQLDLGLMGIFGQVVHRIFTREGIATPTATITPTGMPPASTTPTPEGFQEATLTSEGQETPQTGTPEATPTPGLEGQSVP
jgi:cytoskeleton protein RodZ